MTELFLEYLDLNKFFPGFDKNEMRNLLALLVDDFHISSGKIQVSVVSENELLKMNEEYLQHEDYTDIITFDYSSDKILVGDLFISGNRCIENAELHKTSAENELKRYIIHGVLHLCGMDDKTDELRLAMRERENYYLGKI
jgi:rRNA maturation RNase YbeY